MSHPTALPYAVIIVPTYNERPNVRRLLPILDKVLGAIKNWRVEVLIVDDSSPDGTADEVRDLQKKYHFLHLLVNKKKNGLGAAYLKGMAEVFGTMKADVAMEFDADLSHDPLKIPEFLAKLDAGADLVVGSRYMPGGSIPANWGLHRKFLSVVGNIFITVVLTSRAVHDWTTGYRAIRRSVYEAIVGEMNDRKFSGYTFQIGFLLKTLRHGFKVAEVPFHFVDRTEGVSKLGTEYIINILKYVLWTRWLEISNSRIFKLLAVGTIGFVVNFVFFRLFSAIGLGGMVRQLLLGTATGTDAVSKVLSDQGVAVVLSAEVAIVSNYLWGNFWTFADRQIHGLGKHLAAFLKINLSSVGAILIQYAAMQLGTFLIGIHTLFRIGSFDFATDNIYLVAGVLIGMIWNFTMYALVIWKK
jgi:dolichol-phosphate mannosyltransferase